MRSAGYKKGLFSTIFCIEAGRICFGYFLGLQNYFLRWLSFLSQDFERPIDRLCTTSGINICDREPTREHRLDTTILRWQSIDTEDQCLIEATIERLRSI